MVRPTVVQHGSVVAGSILMATEDGICLAAPKVGQCGVSRINRIAERLLEERHRLIIVFLVKQIGSLQVGGLLIRLLHGRVARRQRLYIFYGLVEIVT